jgi:hypothetical protein
LFSTARATGLSCLGQQWAYINHAIYRGDHGRVLGYDSAHGQQHRHYTGKVTPMRRDDFDQIESRFEREWSRLAKEAKRGKN